MGRFKLGGTGVVAVLGLWICVNKSPKNVDKLTQWVAQEQVEHKQVEEEEVMPVGLVQSYSLALFRSPIADSSSFSSTEAAKSLNCSAVVALTIGAVMLGRASNQASDTLAGVAW
jgi:hypothetical protein